MQQGWITFIAQIVIGAIYLSLWKSTGMLGWARCKKRIIPVPKGMNQYPALASLMRDWFHQDFDIYGNTLESILQEYVKVTPEAARLPVIQEIQRFQEEHGGSDGEMEAAMNSIFEPEVMVKGGTA